jgi:NitT/TauT family transport system ATP-binding protein
MSSNLGLGTVGDRLELPSYLHHTPAVQARIKELRLRQPILEIEELGKKFDDVRGPITVLDNVDFTVRRREFVSVIGPSGCGKSTLVRVLAGLEEPTLGEVRLKGFPVTGPGADRGMVFEGDTLFPWLNVKQNVMFGLKMKGMKSRQAEEKAMSWLQMVGLERFAEDYPAQLSAGTKQRVAIARALASEPRVLLMDEPFGALDAQTRSKMQAHLLDIWASVDVTILFITHDLDEAIYLSDRIVVLGAYPGRVLEIIDVPVERPRSEGHFLSGHFLATKRRLEDLIHGRETLQKCGPDSVHINAA